MGGGVIEWMGLEITCKERKKVINSKIDLSKHSFFSPALHFAFLPGPEKTDVAVAKLTGG